MNEPLHSLESLVGREVVLDARSLFVYIGRLVKVDTHFVLLEDADVHDLRDSSTSREVYVLETKRFGIRANRKRVYVRRDEIVSFSLLDDVIE